MYLEAQLIKTKNDIPAVRPKLVRRPQLFKRLNEIFDYRLATVIAPAGFGKTTLLTSWLAIERKNKLAAAWVSLDEDDNNAESFWSYFLMSFCGIIPKVKKILETISISYESSDRMYKTCLSLFINEVANFHNDLFVIFDDFHIVEDVTILSGMKFLVKNMPSNMHMIILSRVVPDLGLPRLRAVNSLLEINQRTLSFTGEESREFFTDVMGIDLSEEKITYFEKEIEGWPAGLQMAALSLKKTEDNNRDEKTKMDNGFLFEFLVEEVFNNLSEDIKRFLVYTSMVDQFCPELCDFLVSITNSQQLIERIEEQNLFISELDSKKKWFSYHSLFRSFLRVQLELEGKVVVDSLNIKAAKWYEENGYDYKAISNYIKGFDFERAISLIQNISSELLCRGEAKLLNKWIEMLPKSLVINNPRLILNRAWAMCSDGRYDEALSLIEDVLLRLNSLEEENWSIKIEIAVLSIISYNPFHDPDSIIKECEKIVVNLEPDMFFSQLVILNMAIAYLFKGNLSEAFNHFERCLDISKKTGNVYIVITANKAIMIKRKLQGELLQAEKDCLQLILHLETNESIGFPIAGLLYVSLADIYYQWNNLDKALAMGKKALELGNLGDNQWIISESCIVLAKIYAGMGLFKEAMDIIEKAKDKIVDKRFFETQISLMVLKSELLMRIGKVEKASNCLYETISSINDGVRNVFPGISLAQIRLYICKKQFARATEVLNRLWQFDDKFKFNGLKIELLVLESIVHVNTGDAASAISRLEDSVRLAWKQKIERVFINEGTIMEELMRKLEYKLRDGDEYGMMKFILSLLEGFKQNVKSKKSMIMGEILSKREIQILELLQQGASNVEISAKLFLSINTVKTHLLNIYTKLDVHSRTAALAKARKLKLI